MPGAWSSMWESPAASADSILGELAGPLLTDPALPPLPRTAPLPTTQMNSPRTWFKDYNPFGFLQGPTVEVVKDAPEATPQYDLFAEASDLEGNNDAIKKNKPPIVIALFGQTGTGKTSFIKAVTGKDLRIGHDLTSCEAHHLTLNRTLES